MRSKLASIGLGISLAVTPLNSVTAEVPISREVNISERECLNGDSKQQTEGFKLKASVCTEQDSMYSMEKVTDRQSPYFGLYDGVSHGEWSMVPELINFVDNKGSIHLAYSNDKYLFIEKMDDSLKKSKTIKIKKMFPLLGDVVCDDKYYYVVWGQEDVAGQGGITTLAVSKFNDSGNHLGTVYYTTVPISNAAVYKQTRKPFVSGTCDTIITDGVLVANYGRLMYSGHQSNDVVAVNVSNMTANYNYNNYVSHSMDQRVLATSNGVIFANQGDAYPRGFTVGKGTETYFHFYGGVGDNYTHAQLGDLCEINGSIMYSGVSVKGLDASVVSSSKNVFVQIASNQKVLKGSSTRTGTSCNRPVQDNGVLWITDYTGTEEARNPQMLKISKDRFVVLWEKFNNGRYWETFYLVMDGEGNKVSRPTSLGMQRLNTFEPPVLKDNKMIWVTAGTYVFKCNTKGNMNYYGYAVSNGDIATFHEVDLGKYVNSTEVSKPKKGTRFSSGGLRYEIISVKDRTVKLRGADSKKITTINVKAHVKYAGVNYKVTKIAAKAFSKNNALKKITIGNNVKIIESYAFYNCKNLKEVIIGKNVSHVNKYAFCGNKSLRLLDIRGNKIKSFGKASLKGTSPDLKVKVNKSIKKNYEILLPKKGIMNSITWL